MLPVRQVLVPALPVVFGGVLLIQLVVIWASRLLFPFDLEWMEGGMLAHAWRLQQGLTLYGAPTADFVPFIYPPGYPAVLAALGWPTGLSPGLGRVVSLGSILSAAGAIGVVVRREGGPWWLVGAASTVFLGTFPQSGGFYDLVRPDSLGIALMAWSVVLALQPTRRAAVGAAVLLVLAVLVKHNLGAVALPVAVGLARRDLMDAATYVGTVMVGVVGAIGALQLASGGGLLTYLLEVPLSHAVRWQPGLLHSVREWGTALPVPMAAGGLAVVALAVTRQRSVPPWAAASGPIWAGTALGWWLTYIPPAPSASVLNVGAGIAAFSVAAGGTAIAIWGVGLALDALSDPPELPSWRVVMGIGLAATLAVLAWSMRAHDGGFVNVHAPWWWIACLGFGVGLARLCARTAQGAAWASAMITVQLLWALVQLRPATLMPTDADEAAGWRVVDALQEAGGPVLSPFAAWLPVYIGQPPSVHAMAVWDVDHAQGPFQADLSRLDRALREHRWEVVVGGTQGFRPMLPRAYELAESLFEAGDGSLFPQTGWRARPERLLVPRNVVHP